MSNSGYYAWSPDPGLVNWRTQLDENNNAPYTLELTSGSASTISPNIDILSSYFPTDFVNISSWSYPTLGQPTTIEWSPSNESSISIQLEFGAGDVPGPSNTIIIASM